MRVCRWADGEDCEPLGEQLVPGASVHERRRLRALGAIVDALVTGDRSSWPAEIQEWVESAPAAPKRVVELVQEAMEDRSDVLAAIYERAVTPRNRRRLGTFFTSPIMVEHMLSTGERLADRVPHVVVDPGAGVGAFTLAAARRWTQARVIAVDVNVVTLGLLAARLDHAQLSDRAELVLDDFVGWLGRASRGANEVWLTVGNPPFTRSQSLDAETKREAAEAAGDMVSSGHATLSTLFAAAVARQLEPQDSMALVLPVAWTYTRSARELRAGLWSERLRRFELHRWPTKTRAFTGPSVTATVIGLGARQEAPQPFLHGVARVAGETVAISERRSVQRVGECPDPLPGGAGRRRRRGASETIPLEEVLVPRRGIATGANSFFFLTDEEAQLLPTEATRPGICTLRGTPMTQTVLDDRAWRALGRAGARCHLLDIDKTMARDADVAAVLRRGRRLGLHQRYLCRQRHPWFFLEEMDVPDAFVSPLITAHGLRVMWNDVGAMPSNSLYGLFLRESVDLEIGAAVIAWMRSEAGVAALRDHGRQFAGGSIKLEPGELRTLPVPREVVSLDRELTDWLDSSTKLAAAAA